jgi:protease-4
MKSWMKITLLVLAILISVGVFYYLLLSSFMESAPPISRDSYLELNIYGEIPERSYSDPFSRIFTSEPPSMEGLLDCINKAAIDPKIKGIVLRPLGSSIGWGKIEEIRDALFQFQETGKPVYVYLEMAGNRDYYLSLTGDMIFGSPTGMLMINGLLGGSYFIKGTFDKIGVEADFIAHGKYKNAPDIFTRSDMSPAQREVINSILDDYFGRYVKSIGEERDLDQETVRKLINRGMYTISDAVEKGLADTVMYFNEFKDYLKKMNGRSPRFVSYSRYKKIPLSKLGVKARQTIAIIYCSGTIVSGVGDDMSDDGMIISDGMANTIREVANDNNIKGIVLRVDSPGGSGIASDIIWQEVFEARKKKPVIVSVSDMAASGGYYISVSADSIVCEPSSIIGSIGVFAGKFSLKDLYEKLGINKVEIPRGENSDIFSEYDKFSDEQRTLIKQGIDEFYRIFVDKVAEGRVMTDEEVDAIGQGRVWTGDQAVKNGLVDKIGGIKTAINMVKKMCGIPEGQAVYVRRLPRQKSLLDRLLSDGLSVKNLSLLNFLPSNQRSYFQGYLYFKNYEPLAILPFYLYIN